MEGASRCVLLDLTATAWRLYWDYRAVTDIMRVVPENRPMSSKALSIANEIANTFDAGDLERTIPKCRKLCERLFGEGWDAKGADLYKDDFTAKGDKPQVWAVSNCHIDTCVCSHRAFADATVPGCGRLNAEPADHRSSGLSARLSAFGSVCLAG